MKKILFITLLGVCASATLKAQSNFSVYYSMGFGTGDIADFIDKPSFRGASIDYRYSVQPNIAIGFNFAWNTFYKAMDHATYTVENVSLTGKQYRYSNNLPMLATVTYYISPGEKLNPFATLGVGTMYTRRNTDMNLYTVELEAWNFVLQPEVGIQYQLADKCALAISAKYTNGFKSGQELPEAQSYFSLNLGFAFF